MYFFTDGQIECAILVLRQELLFFMIIFVMINLLISQKRFFAALFAAKSINYKNYDGKNMEFFGILIAFYDTALKRGEDDSLIHPKEIRLISQSEKGKPLARMGRKVAGLRFEFTQYDDRRAAGRIQHLSGSSFRGWPCNPHSTMGGVSRTEREVVLLC